MDILCIQEQSNESVDVDLTNIRRGRLTRKNTVQSRKICAKEERNASIKKVSMILSKSEKERTLEEIQTLKECSDTVEEVQLRWRKREEAKQRLKEFEEPADVLENKCEILARAIAQSQHLVVYTGAGISTAARIPDYRGSNGIWTRLQQGKDIGNHDLSLAEPTYTHMALSHLYQLNILKYVVSQNCDGLHLRSGLPKTALSELHGNMYIEVCKTCKPAKEYWRLFDVTENTARYSHKTMRKCYVCNGPLIDSIVHFGERGSLQWPLNWSGACKNATNATTILCLGSSLKVLKKYPWLWQMDKPAKKRPNLYIVNLQWTPKDDCANIKINGKCDQVMQAVMKLLGIDVPNYDRVKDPIFTHATNLCELELHTTTQPFLKTFKEESNECSSPQADDQKKCNYKIQEKQDCLNIETTLDLSQSSSRHMFHRESQKLNCDTVSNSSEINSVKKFSPYCLPELKNDSTTKKTKSSGNMFSIDNILQNNTNNCRKPREYNHLYNNCNNNFVSPYFTPSPEQNYSCYMENQLLFPNYQTVLAYYNISTELLHPQFVGGYSDLFYYPYQTSLMYPGLHNIISPGLKQDSEFIADPSPCLTVEPSNVNNEAKCTFCKVKYDSCVCLFYPKVEPIFVNKKYKYSKLESMNKPNICMCCDYSSDNDSISDGNYSLDNKLSDANKLVDEDIEDKYEKEQKAKVQAGWFGKGYRKNRKFKKK